MCACTVPRGKLFHSLIEFGYWPTQRLFKRQMPRLGEWWLLWLHKGFKSPKVSLVDTCVQWLERLSIFIHADNLVLHGHCQL